jgi:dCTP diphosphatase
MARKTITLASLRADLRRFAAARDWEQFHTPKNLAAALAVEAAELLEHFQWLTPEQSARLGARSKRAVADEIADVLLYLTRLADVLDIDLLAAAQRKMQINARKYPVARAKGNALKYSEHRKGKQ